MYKKLASHTLIYGLSPQIPKILGFIILPIITKDLTKTDYGIYGIILAYMGALEAFKDLGLNLLLYNSFTKMPYQYKWLWRSIYGFLTFWNLIYAILAATLIYFIVPPEAQKDVWLIIVLNLTPLVVFGPTQLIGRIFYQMEEMPMQIAVRTIIFGVLTLVLNLYTISNLKMGYMGWFWSSCLVGILTNISFWYPINVKYKLRPIFNFKYQTIKKSLQTSLPTIPHYYSTYILQTSDKAILNTLNVETDKIGSYNFASMFSNLFGQLGNAMGQAARPLFNTYFKNEQYAKVRQIVFGMQGLFFIITFLTSMWLKEIFAFLVSNKELEASYPIAILLIMSMNYRPMYLGSAGVIMYGEKTKKMLYISFTASVISIILNFSLIPFWGIKAAVFSTFVSMMYMGYSGYFLKELRQINISFHPIKWLLATISITILSWYAVEFHFILKILLTFLLAPTSYILLKKLLSLK